MRVLILLAFIIPFSFAVGGQPQRYLVSPNGKVVPLEKGTSALQTIRSYDCSQPLLIGPEPWGPPPAVGTVAFHHREIAAQWYVSPVTGHIDSLYFLPGFLGGGDLQDSIVLVSFRKSAIGPTHGPGDGLYHAPCSPWGYYKSTVDPDNGIAAFPEDATDTTWYSTVGGPTASFPPMGQMMGPQYPVHVKPYEINVLHIADIAPLNVTKGDVFFITMRQRYLSIPPSQDSLMRIDFRYTTTGTPYPSRGWKFYEHPPVFPSGFDCGPDSAPGWYARGAPPADSLVTIMFYWWFGMTPTGNPPPIMDFWQLSTTTSTAPRQLDVSIVDCSLDYPESSGVASGEIFYSVNGGSYSSTPLSLVGGDTWRGFIPGQETGSTVSYWVKATDLQGESDSTQHLSYRVVSIHSDGYRCDTGYVCTPTSIHFAGVAIDTAEWFLPPSAQNGSQNGDDGTAGPFSLGGPFVFYGDTMHYAWVGVDGAIALSVSATDTIDLNNRGYATSAWDLPYFQHHSRADTSSESGVPKNFIAPYWADWIVKQDSHTVNTSLVPVAVFGKVRHFSDSSRFIVEWDSVGVFDANGAVSDIDVFRVVFNRKTGIIEFQYDNVGTIGQESNPGTLIGLQCDSLTHPVAAGEFPPFNFWNRSGYPVETQLHDGMCIRYVPIRKTIPAYDGWNLVSVATESPNMSKGFMFPCGIIPSQCFWYLYGGYYPCPDTSVSPGVGYWLKNTSCGSIPLVGSPMEEAEVAVNTNWNMIGSIGSPIAINTITVSPPELEVGSFFGYDGSTYVPVTILEPGYGYWVRSLGVGTLYLSANPSTSPVAGRSRIRIVPNSSELPPPPPVEDNRHPTSHIPYRFALEQNYPNPFNPSTAIGFEIRDAGFVSLKVFDVLGREVVTIVDEVLQPGVYSRNWNTDALPSGIYYYRLITRQFTDTKKMVLIR